MERFKEALGVRTRALGAEHADVGATQYKMALVYEEMQAVMGRGDAGSDGTRCHFTTLLSAQIAEW